MGSKAQIVCLIRAKADTNAKTNFGWNAQQVCATHPTNGRARTMHECPEAVGP